jgi:hypothetical protein
MATPSNVPTPRSTSRALAILRLLTLASALVMLFSPNFADRINALGLAGIALARL